MKKIKKVLVVLTIAGAVGITYIVASLRNIPDLFDLEEDDD